MAEPMPLPDLDYTTVPVPASADFRSLIESLAAVTGCEPRQDELGNIQGVYRIDGDGQGGYTLTYPAAANAVAVQAAIDAATPT